MHIFNLKKIIPHLLVIVIFLSLTVVWTYPLIFKLDSTVFTVKEWPFDSLGDVYFMWYRQNFKKEQAQKLNSLIGYPDGLRIDNFPRQPARVLCEKILLPHLNHCAVRNLFVLSDFILAALAMYILAFYLTKNILASFLAGIIFSFAPNHSVQAMAHLSLGIIFTIPLYFLSLFILQKNKKFAASCFCALMFLLVMMFNYYYGYFLILATGIFLIWAFLFYKEKKEKSFKNIIQFFKPYFLTGVMVFLIALPFIFPYVKAIMVKDNGGTLAQGTLVRSYDDLFRYSARVSDYLLPSEHHPLWGTFTEKYAKVVLKGGRHWAERTLYLGFIPFFLFLWYFKERKKEKNPDDFGSFLIVLFFLSIYISLAPLYKIFFLKIPTPSYFLYKIFPMFRVYARIGVLAILAVALITALIVAKKIKNFSLAKQILIVGGLTIGILCEYLIFPPHHYFSLVDNESNQWLKNNKKCEVFAEYPISGKEEVTGSYLMQQIFHQKKIVNCALPSSFSSFLGGAVKDLKDYNTTALLKALNIPYVRLNKKYYAAADIEEILFKNKDLVLEKEFTDSLILSLREKVKSSYASLFVNFYHQEKQKDGTIWRWAADKSRINLYSFLDNQKMEISFFVKPFFKNRNLSLVLNDNKIWEGNVALDKTNFIKLDIVLKKGENNLLFDVGGQADVIAQVIPSRDMRKISVFIGEFKLRSL